MYQYEGSPFSFSVRWPTPPKNFFSNSSVEKYLVLYQGNLTKLYFATWLPAEVTNITVFDLEPFTNYSINVVAYLFNGHGHGSAGWTTVQTEEGGELTVAT